MANSRDAEQFLIKKSYEICYALVRIASSVKREGFGRRLEENGFLLLEAAASSELEKISRVSTTVEYLLRLGSDVGFVHPANMETVLRELQHLNSAIAEYTSDGIVSARGGSAFGGESGNAAKAKEISLDGIFSDLQLAASTNNFSQHNLGETQNINEKQDTSESLENGGNTRSVAKAAIRQSMILERIRQNNNLPDGKAGCRMKEIQEVLPDVSERTIRYDLQGLMGRGAIERTGNGGPATSYRAIQ